MRFNMLTAVVLGLSILGVLWAFTKSRRRLRPLSELLNSIHQGQLKDLDEFLSTNASDGFLETDKSFWILSKGRDGLLRRKENAVCWVQACQHLLSSGMPREDLGYMARRSLLISLLTGTDLIENFVRLRIRWLPHLSARVATCLYWEMEMRVQVLYLTFGTGNWIT